MKVIVAEDELVTSKILCNIVSGLGHTPISCSRGDTAWSVLVDNPDTALVLTDIQMPGLNGRELINKKMANQSLISVPIIIVSGVVRLSEITDLLGSGASYFMPKPINTKDLAGYITRLVEQTQSARLSSKPSEIVFNS